MASISVHDVTAVKANVTYFPKDQHEAFTTLEIVAEADGLNGPERVELTMFLAGDQLTAVTRLDSLIVQLREARLAVLDRVGAEMAAERTAALDDALRAVQS
jgi:hypothetical protein